MLVSRNISPESVDIGVGVKVNVGVGLLVGVGVAEVGIEVGVGTGVEVAAGSGVFVGAGSSAGVSVSALDGSKEMSSKITQVDAPFVFEFKTIPTLAEWASPGACTFKANSVH
jgi:hypothetical protein